MKVKLLTSLHWSTTVHLKPVERVWHIHTIQSNWAVGDSKDGFTFHTKLRKVGHLQGVAPLDGRGEAQDLPIKHCAFSRAVILTYLNLYIAIWVPQRHDADFYPADFAFLDEH